MIRVENMEIESSRVQPRLLLQAKGFTSEAIEI